MNTIQLRRASAQDLRRCMDLLDALNGATGGPSIAGREQTFTDLLDGARGEVLVAQEGGNLLGLASVSYNLAMRYGGEYCQLEELIVDPAARGKNVGGLLMSETVSRARTRGCAEIGLYLVESTEHNQPFYEKYGFVKVGSELRQVL